jgi:hypothetical protein
MRMHALVVVGLLGVLMTIATGCGGAMGSAGRVVARDLAIPGDADTTMLVLSNRYLSVSFLPEIGGKIISIRDAGGREYVSRSTVPYVRRTFGMSYGETEFDGIDECFPSLGKCAYPAGPWEGTEIVDHGELCTSAWEHVPGDGVVLEARGVRLPYVFRRQATLEGRSLVLRYSVRNLSDHPMPYIYLFHPLLAGDTGCGLEIPPQAQILIGPSKGGFLGQNGDVKSWSQLRDERGRPFEEFQFASDSGRYYKYYTDGSETGRTALRYADGSGLGMTWSSEQLPYLAVWCSEGGVQGLHHLAPEPSVSQWDRLDEAYRGGQAAVIPPSGVSQWWIRLELLDSERE